MTARVLLIASIDAIGVARLPSLLGKAGFRVTLLGPPRLAAARSRYVNERVVAPGDPKNVAQVSDNHLAQHRDDYDWVVFADEPVLWAAVDYFAKGPLASWFPFPRDAESVQTLTSKVRFLQAAERAGLKVPEFRVCTTREAVVEAADMIGYPAIVKTFRGLAGSGLMFARSREDLRNQIADTAAHATQVMVQQVIDGESGSTSVLYSHGRPVCWFSYLMQETWPTRFSSACLARIFVHRDVDELVSRVGAMTRFHGLAGIDWMRDRKTDRLVLLEINPRPTPTYHLGRYAGVDFSKALANMHKGSDSVQHPGAGGAEIAMFPQMLYRSVDGWKPGAFLRTFGDAPWDDPTVMLSQLRRLVTHFLPTGWKLRRPHAETGMAAQL